MRQLSSILFASLTLVAMCVQDSAGASTVPDRAKPDTTTLTTPPETTTPAPAPTTVAPTTDTTNPPTTTAPAPAPPTTAAPTPTADDGDGVAATIEDAAPNGGDGNRDGLVDSRQSNVASLPAAVDVNGDGALDDYVTIVAPEATTLTDVRALQVPSDNPPPDGVRLPYGLFEYDVTVASPGDTAEVTYILPDEGVEPTSVHMLQNGVWADYADHTSVDSVDGNVTVALRDGGDGDETGTTDGVIKDPSGPSTTTTPDLAAPTPTAPLPAPTIVSDKADYPPGGTVVLTGTNWLPLDTVIINVNDDTGKAWEKDVTVHADANGELRFTFDLPNNFIASYTVTAAGSDGRTATTTFTDANPSGNLDQCANGSAPSPPTDGCTTSASWVNGNLNQGNSSYIEGNSVPYRIVGGDIPIGPTNTVTIEWDTLKGGKHAIDFITSYNRTVGTANPCVGVSPACGAVNTLTIPPDSAAGGHQIPGVLTMWGGTMSNAVYSSPGGADAPRRLTITFTATQANPVLAWGGHIATRLDWGFGNSAAAISGSPYHMRLIDVDGSGGNQDRSLSAAAVIIPATISIVKDAVPDAATPAFPFTATGPEMLPTSFTLTDNGVDPALRTQTFTQLTTFGTARTVTEGPVPTGWTLSGLECAITPTPGLTPGTVTPNGAGSGPTATFNLNEGDVALCTFTNVQQGTVSIRKQTVPNGPADFSFTATGGATPANFILDDDADATRSNTQVLSGVVVGQSYVVTETTANQAGFTLSDLVCTGGGANTTWNVATGVATIGVDAGETIVCAFTNTQASAPLTLQKAWTNSRAGDTADLLATGSQGAGTATATAPNPAAAPATLNVFGGETVNLSEVLGAANLGSYAANLTCTAAGLTYTAGNLLGTYTMPTTPAPVTCTFTNTRTQVASTTATVIHNAAHAPVTSVPAGTPVHDQATVTGEAGLPIPTGTVTFSWFTNGTCAAPAAATSSAFTLAGGAVDATTFAFTPGVAGSFAFQASYSGDGTYTGSTGPCELLTVTPLASTTATVIHDAAHAPVTSVPAGTTVHDQATVTGQAGLPVPTGTVTFSWFTNGTCAAPAVSTSSAFALAGGVVDGTTFTQTPNVAGSFAFQATYSGDGTYNPSTGPCELLTVTPLASTTATVIHNAAHAPVTSVAAGTTVHDQATVTGTLSTPTGTVTFSWFTNGTCAAPPVSTSSPLPLAGGAVDATTFAFTPGVAGSFAFQATYSGDGTYAGSTGPCEPLTVTTVASSTVTVIHDAAHATVTSVPVGTTVHDQATVTGQAGLPVPTGTVTFRWFTTDAFCTGIPAATSSPFTLNGSGVADGTTFPQTPVTFGTFSFRATYSGDGTYAGSVGPCEPLLVTRVASTTVTVIHDAAHATVTSVAAGTTVHDQATVTGQAGLPVPTGTVTFSWFTNGTCAAPAAATSSRLSLAGGVVDGTTFTQTPNVAGSFAFQATYSGDGTYNPSTATVIHGAAHAPVTSVAAGTTVHDQATVTGQAGLPVPTGTVTFSWFTNGTCAAPPVSTSSVFSLAGGAVDGTTFAFTPGVAGSFAFQATYSGDGTYAGSTGPCEPLTVTTVASSTVTVIHDAAHATVTSVPVGTTVHDQATVTGQAGLPVPTGTVTFRWFTTDAFCTGIPAATSSPFTLNGSGVADGTTFPQTPVTFGTFSFRATYSGDGTYNGSVGPCEPLLVTRVASTTASVIHDAAHAPVTSVAAGTTVHDQATVTGQAGLPVPTGTVTFSWFTNGTCAAPAAATSSAFSLAGGVVDGTTFTQTPNVAGSFAFQATYSGDGTYTGSTGPCEPLTVTTVASSTATVIHDATHQVVTSVPAGTTVHDQATVTGALATPTGTVTFTWFTNGTCATPGAATSSAFPLSGGVADATGFAFTPGASGSFAFQASYSGDATYDPSTGPCEPLVVTKIASGTASVIHDATHQVVTSVPAGTTVHDQATVTGALATPTGTVTFDWFTNGTCTAPAAATSDPFTLDAAGVADATTFPQTSPTGGEFAFQASYSGDGTYDASTGPCEPLSVTPVATSTVTAIHDANHATVVSVLAGTTVHDQATVTGGLGTPTGTVTFAWFTNGTCTAPAAATSDPFTLDGSGVADGTPFAFTPGVSGSFAFQASYSGDGTYTGSTGDCEPLTVQSVALSPAEVAGTAGAEVARIASAEALAVAFTGFGGGILLAAGVALTGVGLGLLLISRPRRGRSAAP